MIGEIQALFARYRQKGILVDTNILLLYFVGNVNRERISRFNRTEKFLPEDFDLLLQILEYFQTRVTTPNILTEVNSLVNQLGEPERSQCYGVFAQHLEVLDEFYIASSELVRSEKFAKFGLTDSSILQLAQNRYLVLTDDLRLASYLQNKQIDVINFNNIRTFGWN
ncbi:PIN domain-containing protein [Myxacorys almedinensis]|uniref:PIN domain-containing protein n=1 Tax=Myxacorys almedinensis A TaxID=2690445 RepID=A0A8J7Z1R0_9CYAN|nr:PIN domain-containing protein [Myxacorys almedinensis]NDJ17620.1 hypothetical protein [Myxacorys almedinensis A]